MQSTNYDAIVVGSGISGGWAAKELSEKGLRVLLLERGRNVEHIKDYVNATKAPWQYPHRGGRTKAMEELYPVLKRDYPLNEKNLDFWQSDRESPAAPRRPVPTGDATQLRRGARRGTSQEVVRRTSPTHHRPDGEQHEGAARAQPVSVPQRVLARMSLRRLLQHAVIHAAGGDEDGTRHAQTVVDRHRSVVRQGQEAREGRSRPGRGHEPDHRLLVEGRVPVRVHVELYVVVD